jgi:hypothetical protein
VEEAGTQERAWAASGGGDVLSGLEVFECLANEAGAPHLAAEVAALAERPAEGAVLGRVPRAPRVEGREVSLGRREHETF